MNRMVTIDPGINCAGLAVWEDSQLIAAMSIRISKKGHVLDRATRMGEQLVFHAGEWTLEKLLIEWPKVYDSRQAGKVKGQRPSDLLPLCAVCGTVAPAFREVEIVEPFTWKGHITKAVTKARILKPGRLSVAERACFKNGPFDMYDAIGIGLWHHGRFDGRIFPGATH